MKKKRLFLIFVICVIFVFVFILGSPIFKLKNVEIKFVNEKNEVVLLKNNSVFNSQQKIKKIISSANFDFGTSIFLLNKQNYVNNLDKSNPYFKLINISTVFPNKIVVYARERKPIFYISNNLTYLLVDGDFKILESTNIKEKTNNLIEIIGEEDNDEKNYFEFFDIPDLAYEPSQYLYENNLILESIKSISSVFNKFNFYNKRVVEKIVIYEKENLPNIKLLTNKVNFGAQLEIEDVLVNFDKKMNKLLSAFNTLIDKEKIKTTYGVLSVNSSCNCYWNNL